MKAGSQSWKFNNNVYLLETATAVGPLESQGPLKMILILCMMNRIVVKNLGNKQNLN